MIATKFTDDDLNNLKNELLVWPYGSGLSEEKLTALLARLEAAESCVQARCTCVAVYAHKDHCEVPAKTKTWLTAAGK